MTTIQKKLLVAGIALVGGVSYLAFAGMKSGWVYFMEVDQFLVDRQSQSQRVRLHGKVGPDEFNVAGLDARFVLLGKTRSLPVTYHGVIPDLFQRGRDVVAEGKLDSSGTFKAEIIMTKCASKYEPNSPHKDRGDQP